MQRTGTLAFCDWSSIRSRLESSPRGQRWTLSSRRDRATGRALSTAGTVATAVDGGHGPTGGDQARLLGSCDDGAGGGRRGRSRQAGAPGRREEGRARCRLSSDGGGRRGRRRGARAWARRRRLGLQSRQGYGSRTPLAGG